MFFFNQPYQGHSRRCQTDDNYFLVDYVTLEFFRRLRAAYHASSIGRGEDSAWKRKGNIESRLTHARTHALDTNHGGTAARDDDES